MAIGLSDAETFWTTFPRSLAHRGLCGVKVVIAYDQGAQEAPPSGSSEQPAGAIASTSCATLLAHRDGCSLLPR